MPSPGYLLRSTGIRALSAILSEGLRKMTRNAIHLIPAVFNSRQSLYIQRRKTPFAILTDGNAAMEDGHRFYRTPNDVVLCDGGMDGLLVPDYLVGLYDYYMANHRDRFSRLRLSAAKSGVRPVPPHSGELGDIPDNIPRREDGEYCVLSREHRFTPQ